VGIIEERNVVYVPINCQTKEQRYVKYTVLLQKTTDVPYATGHPMSVKAKAIKKILDLF
jgi:hypothetical protein